MTWTLSEDGKSMNVESTNTRADGSTSQNQVRLKRVVGASGFAGTWESTSLKVGSPEESDIQLCHGDGLSFNNPKENDTLNLKFDGKDCLET